MGPPSTTSDQQRELAHLLLVQDGVLARRQLVVLGLDQGDLDRMLRRRELRRLLGARAGVPRARRARPPVAPGRPAGRRPNPGGTVYRDVRYAAWGVLVELDGQAFHRGARQRARDMDRDLEAVASSRDPTLRLGWQQVLRDHCLTARRVVAVLQRQGWGGHLTPCRHCST